MPKGSILIIDDDKEIIVQLNKLFIDDYKIFFATDGEKGLELASSEQPDIILLDILMPGINGFEVMENLKADFSTKDIPVIFITALQLENEEEKGLSLGAMDYIHKPIKKNITKVRVSNTIEFKQQRDLLTKMVNLDGLTKIYNRKFFDETLEREINIASRRKEHLGMLLMDIDFFKLYNDEYGHVEGDHALIRVAEELKNSLIRKSDFAARYGGEEFIVVLPDTPLDGCRIVANRIKKNIDSLQIEHKKSKVADNLTLSIGGVSIFVDKNYKSKDLVKIADEMLYKAKNNGRNRIELIESRSD